MHEEHVWPFANTADRNLTLTHIDKAVRPGTEEIGGLRDGKIRHRFVPFDITWHMEPPEEGTPATTADSTLFMTRQ